MKGWAALGGALAFTIFRLRWWRRCHYHTLLGKTLSHPERVEVHCRLLDEIARVFAENKVDWWMDSGTLLGAWRHQGYIPWDDDADIGVLHSDHQRILGLPFRAPFRMIEISRLWSVDKVVPGLARLWPCQTYLRLLDPGTQLYVDIFEFEPRPPDRLQILPLSLIHSTRDPRGNLINVPRDFIFPLITLPYEGRNWPAPARPREYLEAYYGENLEPDHIFDEPGGKWVSLRPRRWKI